MDCPSGRCSEQFRYFERSSDKIRIFWKYHSDAEHFSWFCTGWPAPLEISQTNGETNGRWLFANAQTRQGLHWSDAQDCRNHWNRTVPETIIPFITENEYVVAGFVSMYRWIVQWWCAIDTTRKTLRVLSASFKWIQIQSMDIFDSARVNWPESCR